MLLTQVSRFQAQTSPVLDHDLDDLRQRLGWRPNQKADLLREITALAAWVVRQAEAGRQIEARLGRHTEALQSPIVDRLRRRRDRHPTRVALDDQEVEALAAVLDRGLALSPALRETLARLADPKRRPPRLRWR